MLLYQHCLLCCQDTFCLCHLVSLSRWFLRLCSLYLCSSTSVWKKKSSSHFCKFYADVNIKWAQWIQSKISGKIWIDLTKVNLHVKAKRSGLWEQRSAGCQMGMGVFEKNWISTTPLSLCQDGHSLRILTFLPTWEQDSYHSLISWKHTLCWTKKWVIVKVSAL